jgi:hypothetical protein
LLLPGLAYGQTTKSGTWQLGGRPARSAVWLAQFSPTALSAPCPRRRSPGPGRSRPGTPEPRRPGCGISAATDPQLPARMRACGLAGFLPVVIAVRRHPGDRRKGAALQVVIEDPGPGGQAGHGHIIGPACRGADPGVEDRRVMADLVRPCAGPVTCRRHGFLIRLPGQPGGIQLLVDIFLMAGAGGIVASVHRRGRVLPARDGQVVRSAAVRRAERLGGAAARAGEMCLVRGGRPPGCTSGSPASR